MGSKHQHSSILTELLATQGNKNALMIRRVVTVGCIVNLLLMVSKLVVGYMGHSDALMADGYHSLNDFAADLIMLLFIGISFKPADDKFSYGYGKFETFSTFLISIFLFFVAFHITEEALESIVSYFEGEILPQPDIWTVVIVIVSMLAKESLFRYYRRASQKANSPALLTNAWHHRSDALASIATLIGVSFSRFLGESWRILDPIASLILVLFIVFPAYRMLRPAYLELMEGALDAEEQSRAKELISLVDGIKEIRKFGNRKNGHYYLFDVELVVDGNLSVAESNRIIEAVRESLEKEFKAVNATITAIAG